MYNISVHNVLFFVEFGYSYLNDKRILVNNALSTSEPWFIILTTCLTMVVLQRLSNWLFQDKGFVPGPKRGILKKIRNFPIVRSFVAIQVNKVKKHLERNLKKHFKGSAFKRELPDKGWAAAEIFQEAKLYQDMSTVKWKQGRASGTIYSGNDETLDVLMRDVFSLTQKTNPLHSDVFPGIRKMEAEIVRWACHIFNGDSESCGIVTSGGTESIFLACKAFRDYAFDKKGISQPEMVIPVTAHAAFDKSCQYLRIKSIHIPVDPKTMKVNLKKMKAAITKNTILLVGSAPQYPHGIIDPMEEIGKLGLKYNIPVHTDCCLGGFLVPFMNEAGYPVPPSDFSVPGITSISADTHKYAYAPKGTSVVLYKSETYRKYQYSVQTDWPGGVYATPCVSGSRSGAVIATCWATMLYFGRKGYVESTRNIVSTTRYILERLEKIEEIFVYGDPQASIFALGSKVFNIYLLNEHLNRRGWSLNSLQYPSGFHLCCTLQHTQPGVADKFIEDVKESVQEIMLNPSNPGEGQAAVYGMAQSVPDRSIVEELAWIYIDTCYDTEDLPFADDEQLFAESPVTSGVGSPLESPSGAGKPLNSS